MDASGSAKAQLTVNIPNGQTRVIHLEKDRYELGRDDSNALAFQEVQGLSRKHVVFERNGAAWTVRDLGSTNGTFVNGNRLTAPRTLAPRDRVSAGALTILYSEPTPQAALQPAKPASHTVLFVKKTGAIEEPTAEATLDGVLASDPELKSSGHMRALIQAGRELCGQTSLDELFQVIMNLSIEAVGASRGVLITVEGGQYKVRAQKGDGFEISTHVRDTVISEKRSLIVHDALSDEALAARSSIVAAHVRGILAVPLQTDKNVIGLIYLDSPAEVKAFSKDDLNVLTVLANIAAIRLEQARLAEIEKAEMVRARELEHAALIQRSILPPEGRAFPDRTDFELSASMVPALEVGGDLFDYFLLDEHRLGFVVGDVSGKGVPAALFMAVARTLLRAAAEHQSSPGDCFTYMNNSLAENNPAGMYVTVFYGVLDTRTGELTFANGGHNPPLVVSPGGKIRRLMERSGPMIGLFPGKSYRTDTARLEPGQCLVIHTDGVTEAFDKNQAFFGDERLFEFLQRHSNDRPSGLVARLQAEVRNFAVGVPQADDITLLVLRRG